MTNQIILKDGKLLVGVANVVVSEIDDTIYINSSTVINHGIEGSLAYYNIDGTEISNTGLSCVWDPITKALKSIKLECVTLNSEDIQTYDVRSTNVRTQYLESNDSRVYGHSDVERLSVNYWLGFNSKIKDLCQPFKITNILNPQTNKEALIISSNDYDEGKPTLLMGFEDHRIYVNGDLSIKARSIESAVGSDSDIKGDLAIDENYIYYCIKDYDGVSNIWKRSPLSSW